MLTVTVLLLFLIAYGIWERRSHLLHLRSIPVRIHVNGSRGKSTVTRLIAAGLRAGGSRVIAKTTGTKPRIILEDGREVPILRVGPANIIEQLMVVRQAWQRRADILLVECMAVQPHLQEVSEEQIIQSTVGIITNARADHLDQMGPTVRDVAMALSSTIPRKGIMFTSDREWLPVFEANARERGTTMVCADSAGISREDLDGFSYIEHADNVALALTVAAHFGVPRDAALRSMQRANPDPGVLRGYCVRLPTKTITFYNAFAANDRDSTLIIWRRLGMANTVEHPVFVVINNRGDRLQRSEQFAHMMAEDLDARYFFLLGDFTHATQEIALRLGLAPDRIINMGNARAEDVFETIAVKTDRRATVIGIGNIKANGEELVSYFRNRGAECSKQPSV